MRRLILSLCLLTASAAFAQGTTGWRASTPEEQRLDAEAFAGFDEGIGRNLGDVQSVVVVLRGRTVYQYYRDGDAEALRDVQSVTKSALALLVGTALQKGQLASLDRPVLELMPEWRALNPDVRAQGITLRHLLAMTTGFDVDNRSGTAPPVPPTAAWARPLGAAPGERFAYDNSGPPMVAAVLERVTARPLADLVREQLVLPMGMREPSLRHSIAWLRTIDIARLGQLTLQDGRWDGQALLPEGFVAQLTQRSSAGGDPVGLPYGLGWWMPSPQTWFASGYAGQLVWVHAPLQLVVAVTSTVSTASQQRGQALGLARGRIFQAAQKRLAADGGSRP